MHLVFDLDGTLIDSSGGILGTLRHTFDVMGFPLLPDMRKFIGPPLEWAFMEFLGVDRETAVNATKVYRAEYAVTGVLGVEVYDGIPEALETLQNAGHCLHIATSKPEAFALRIFDNIGLRKHFTHICGAGMDGTRAKKAEVLAELFRRGGVDAPSAETLSDWRMIGDRIYDVEGAAAFGMKSIGVSWGFGPVEEFSGAEAVADSPAELAAMLLGR
ncbi:MAG: HAD hydrolase-like protein [Clostridia bacterium]|nr:HAD hydrolase-like protein [Clostridia bacterium]